MGGRDHSCEGCGRGGFNDPEDKCECPPELSQENAQEVARLARTVYLDFQNLTQVTTLGAQGRAIVELSNSMHDLVSWLPGWDYEAGLLLPEEASE